MEEGTQGNQTKNESSGDDKTPSRIGDSGSMSICGSNSIDLGCGTKSTAATSKFLNGSTATKKATIPLPLGAPVPSSLAMQQTTMPRFVSNSSAQQQQPINLSINTTTGGNFDVTVDSSISVESLKKIIAKKLKVAKDRIRLLHRERELQDGSLKDYNLMDGSKIILIPNVETGLLAQRPENTVMQALESLNDSQVNDFLSGKTPLNLSMRLGDHMMLIQLQLSTVNPAGNSAASSYNVNGSNFNSSRLRSSSQRTGTRIGTVSGTTSTLSNHHTHHHHHHHHHNRTAGGVTTNTATCPNAMASSTTSNSSVPITMVRKANGDLTPAPETLNRLSLGNGNGNAGTTNSSPLIASSGTSPIVKGSDLSSFLSKRDFESLQNIVKSIAMTQPARLASAINAQRLNSISSVTNSQGLRSTIVLPTNAAASVAATTNNSSKMTNFPASHNASEAAILEQSPIKSLSNLVSSSPIETTTIKNIPPTVHGNKLLGTPTAIQSHTGSTIVNSMPTIAMSSPMLSCQDPIAAKLTSCLCTRLNASSGIKSCIESSCLSRSSQDITMSNIVTAQRPSVLATSTPNKITTTNASPTSSSESSMLHKTANNPIMRSKHRHHHHHHHHHHHYHNGIGGGSNTTSSSLLSIGRPKVTNLSPRCIAVAASSNTTSSPTSNDSGFTSDDSMQTLKPPANGNGTTIASSTSQQNTSSSSHHSVDMDDSGIMTTDTRTLAEASRNLTQTLRKLSKEVFTNKIDLSSAENTTNKIGSGAVIESMKNHGKGIYSGTFSGTLNPALQDRYGRPKRDISTVIHILNDLLSATPPYSRPSRISFESPSSSSASSNSGSKQLLLKNSHSHSQSCVKCLKTHSLLGQQSTNSNNTSINSNGTSNSITNNNTSQNSSTNCNYGECNGHYTSNGSNNKSTTKSPNYGCCPNVQKNSSSFNSTDSSNVFIANDRNVCSCRFRNVATDGSETVELEREHTCQKCLSEMEMLRTKSKLDQLRLVMQQRKQKREARKLKGAPYGARVVGATATATNIGNTEISEAQTSATKVAAAAALASTVDAASSLKTSSSKTLTTAPPSEVSPNHIVEEVDTAA